MSCVSHSIFLALITIRVSRPTFIMAVNVVWRSWAVVFVSQQDYQKSSWYRVFERRVLLRISKVQRLPSQQLSHKLPEFDIIFSKIWIKASTEWHCQRELSFKVLRNMIGFVGKQVKSTDLWKIILRPFIFNHAWCCCCCLCPKQVRERGYLY